MSAPDKLIELPIMQACFVKWEAGRKKHGPVFVGDPVEELFGELIDGLNYVEEAEAQGHRMGTIWQRLMEMAAEVQNVHRSFSERKERE